MKPKSRNTDAMRPKIAVAGAVALILVYFVCMVVFHYQQLDPDMRAKGLLSDLPDHLRWALEGTSYSLNSVFMNAAFQICGNLGVSLVLSVSEVLTVVGLAFLIRYFTRAGWGIALFLGLGCSVEMAFHFGGQLWYLGTITGAIYHNSTYIVMQAFAVPAFLAFLEVYQQLNEKIDWKRWLVYTVLLTLTTACKPSFLFGFAPALLLVLIVDFVKTRARNIPNEVLLGISVFPSLPIGLFQSTIRYTPENDGSIIFEPLSVWNILSQGTIWTSLLRSMVFVAIVFVALLVWKEANKKYRFSVIFLTVSVLEVLLLAESGTTHNDGNMFWTAFSAMMLCFTISTALWYDLTKKQFSDGKTITLRKGVLIAGWVAFAVHVLTGAAFIFQQLTGNYVW